MYKMVNKYYQKYKERLWNQAHERYQNLSEGKKRQKTKKGPRQISKSFWRTKAETTWIYEKILFSAYAIWSLYWY